ncbi:hypothetical protein IF1G_04039 [Cordyceps javanica]|uniref:Uncharacterized protein n=1 Tax=Cordyceps javanica TaxID=43265 RepID=A0A545V514_9HYPO|nr:hypothetical protein IF1G_04039 [Cordyceps javanica]TQW08068.1 hypothetical protein IF2G_03944 [Cordyceps javanica]
MCRTYSVPGLESVGKQLGIMSHPRKRQEREREASCCKAATRSAGNSVVLQWHTPSLAHDWCKDTAFPPFTRLQLLATYLSACSASQVGRRLSHHSGERLTSCRGRGVPCASHG